MTEGLLLATTLRDDYEVLLRRDGDYSVVVTDRHGTSHEERITAETAEWLRDRLRGRQVDRAETAEALALAPQGLNLSFTHGFKLGY